MSMVERVARALCYSQLGSKKVHGDARCCQAGGTEGCCIKEMLDDARAAIAAMREPTPEMLDEGPPEPYMDSYVWGKMIDAALMEGTAGNADEKAENNT
jgi:hypothetical protein